MIRQWPERPTRRTAIAAIVGAGVGAACGRSAACGHGAAGGGGGRASSEPALEAAAEQYVRLALRLAHHQPSLIETWEGPEAWSRGPRQPVAAIRGEIEDLGEQLRVVGSRHGSARHTYVTGQVAALHVAARRLSGESMTFAAEAGAALALPPSAWRLGAGAAARTRAELDRLVTGRGPLHERVQAVRRRHAIEPDRVAAALGVAIRACREGVARWMSFPPGEQVTLSRVGGVGAEARATWPGGPRTEVRLDERARPDVVHLVWLAAHETYAGHHLQHMLLASDATTAAVPIERRLQPAFGPHLLQAEGGAEAGAFLLLDERTHLEMCDRVCRAIGVPAATDELIAIHQVMRTVDSVIPQIAEEYLDGGIGQALAIERLAVEGLVPDAPSLLGVIERQRTRLLAYPIGRRLVTQALGIGSLEQQWSRLRAIATTLTLE